MIDYVRRVNPAAFALAAIFAFLGPAARAQDAADSLALSLGATGYAGQFDGKPGVLSDEERGSLAYSKGPFGILVDVSLLGDGKYPAHNVYELGHYFQPNDCVVRFGAAGLTIKGGRGRHRDEIDSPYSLFISSSDISAFFIDMSWETDVFLYRSRWVPLNYNSDQYYEGTTTPFIDRGLNYKVYEFKLGEFRFGYQDASVYVGQAFDCESFVSPIPTYLQQMILASSGRPYSEEANPNSLMGFFCEWKRAPVSAYGQVLIDDINASFLAPILGWAIPALNNVDNVQKLAWALGGSWDTSVGRFSLHHAGATKYCFESTYTSTTSNTAFGLDAPGYNSLPYPYVYYPATTYMFGSVEHLIYPAENYIGYRNGENNLAFMARWNGDPGKGLPWAFSADADIEYVVSGSQSPANPWHELETWVDIGKAFVMFDESTLEHSLILSLDAKKKIGAWTFAAGAQLGWIWNPLKPTAVTGHPEEAKIWKPDSGASKGIFGFSLGASYTFEHGGR